MSGTHVVHEFFFIILGMVTVEGKRLNLQQDIYLRGRGRSENP